ncbi:hypothetical protein HYPSUDRAFT_447933 [Hypholoma sublateritium FD-334 SS-4]|uniref:Uncharacterized protein n=1 Tax=Hypholoma sublateritium (strain FD-334 SS-4) TaxID=945553 RepID=A0A0D2KI80_HYPSF|nr:hypothetical protein HYPSUDRAFT_447933 [Hypholoma sublateritium FD-334 SS-4]
MRPASAGALAVAAACRSSASGRLARSAEAWLGVGYYLRVGGRGTSVTWKLERVSRCAFSSNCERPVGCVRADVNILDRVVVGCGRHGSIYVNAAKLNANFPVAAQFGWRHGPLNGRIFNNC